MVGADLCRFIEQQVCSAFKVVKKEDVISKIETAARVNALRCATAVMDFAKEIEARGTPSGLAPHCTTACELWNMLVDFRESDLTALSNLTYWFANHKTEH